MLQKVVEFVDKHYMIKKGDKIIVALSGGPDSICLIHILNKLKDKYGIQLYAAHVNHCLRGKDSDGDESYAEEFCKSLGIEFFSKRIDINEMAERLNMSSETAGREARYNFFDELRESLGADKVALAHNLNDQAETVLMRIIRGAGIEGLQGIKPIRDGIYIRPILSLSRSEIEQYCEDNNLNPRTDKSNFENIYNRNKIRLELIPYIEKNFNKDIINTLNRLSGIVSKDNEYLESVAREKYLSYCICKENSVTVRSGLLKEKESIVSRVIRKALSELKGDLKNIELVHINDIIELFTMGTGKEVHLPGGIHAENIYGDINIYIYKHRKVMLGREVKESYMILDKSSDVNEIPSIKFINEIDVTISIRLMEKGENINFGEDTLKRYFDYDKIRRSISLRHRREGDRYTPYGMKGSKKIKDLFIDLKIPKDERDSIPLICFDEEIAWVVGYSVSNNYSVTKNTNNILEIKVEKGEN